MTEDRALTIWAVHCPFRRDGAPVVGTFGSREKPVIIMTAGTWAELCGRVPELGRMPFRVGTVDGADVSVDESE